jgi:pseudouridine-5'-phosphate glycosidase
LEAPYNVETPPEAAVLIDKLFQLQLNSGILLAVPIPETEAMEGKGKLYYHLPINVLTQGTQESFIINYQYSD